MSNKDRHNNTIKYHQNVNKDGVTQVTKSIKAAKMAGKDCGESESLKNIEDLKKNDPSFQARIKRMVKPW